MKALCYMKPGLQVCDIAEPQLVHSDDVKIKICYASICASDKHIVEGEFDQSRIAGMPIGHEASGIVVELGPDATTKGLKVGDRVTYYFNQYCGKCHYCRSGQEHLCSNIKGNSTAFSEYVVCSEQQVYKLPDSVDLITGCISEPVSVCLHGADMANIIPGNSVAIYGGGGIGLIFLQLAKLAGATNLTLIEPVEEKCGMALRLGADHVLNPSDPAFSEKVASITNGLGFDAIIEASGSPKAAESALQTVGRGGTIVYFSLYPAGYTLSVNMFSLFYKEITIRGVFQSPYVFPRVMSILPKLDLSDLTSKIFSIDQGVEAFECQRTGKYPKIVLKIAEE